MSNRDSEPPARSVSWNVPILTTGGISQQLTESFTKGSAEAQMLEHSIKAAITKDVSVFAEAQQQVSFIEALETVTLGQAKDIAVGQASRAKHKAISLCTGFYEVVSMHWFAIGRPEPELKEWLAQAVKRRNRIAHQLLAEVINSILSEAEAIRYLDESSHLFFRLRELITVADFMSSKLGSVACDGSSLPRAKQTLK